MRIERDEVFDLFRKWETERSLLLCTLGFPFFAAKFNGRIAKLTSVELRLVSDDSEFAMTFRPDMEFYYQDVRNTPEESHLFECGVGILFSGDKGKPATERDHIGLTEVKETQTEIDRLTVIRLRASMRLRASYRPAGRRAFSILIASTGD